MGLNRNLGNIPEVITVSSGNAGVGSSPTLGKLQVTDSNGVSLAIKNTTETTTGSEFCQITFNNTSNAGGNFESAKIKAVSTNGGANLSNLIFENSGSERMRISSAGNVYIGPNSTNSSVKLKVEDTGSNSLLSLNTTDATGRTTIDLTTNGYDWEIGARGSSNSPANSLYIYNIDNSAYRFIITPSGNVLIGTQTDTGNKLQVAGPIQSQNFGRKQISLQTTPQSLGLPINAYSGGGAYLLLISTQFDAGNGTGAALWMIRCGYNGNNFEATQISVSNTASGISFSQVNGILHISGNTNWAANIQVISNNILF